MNLFLLKRPGVPFLIGLGVGVVTFGLRHNLSILRRPITKKLLVSGWTFLLRNRKLLRECLHHSEKDAMNAASNPDRDANERTLRQPPARPSLAPPDTSKPDARAASEELIGSNP